MNPSWSLLFLGVGGPARLESAAQRVPTLREDGWTGLGPRARISFPGSSSAWYQKESDCVQESPEVKAIGTGPEWVMRAKGPEEPRCVAKRESREREPEIVCVEDTSSQSV